MDPISIITLAASTTKAAYTVSTQLYLFVNAVKDVDKSVQSLTSELSGLRRSLDATSVALDNPHVRSETASAPENAPVWAAVAGALDDCRQTLQALEEQVAPHQKESSRRSIFKRSMTTWKLNLSKDEINGFRDQVHTHTGSLQIALQTLNILVSGIGPAKAAHDIGERIASLTNILENTKIDREQPPHYQQVESVARSLLSNTSEVVSTGLLVSTSQESRNAAKASLKDVLADFDDSVHGVHKSKESSDTVTERNITETVHSDTDASDSEDELEWTLAKQLLDKARASMSADKYKEAEAYIRDAFGHLGSVARPSGEIDIDEARYELAICCLRQNKVEEAELILLLLMTDRDEGDDISLRATHALATVYMCLFDFAAALEKCSIALKRRRKLHGKHASQYHSSLQLLSLIYHVNGDYVSSAAYGNKVEANNEPSDENIYAANLFRGYVADESRRMSLKEKRSALNELAAAAIIASQREPSPSASRLSSADRIIQHPDLGSLNLNKTLMWSILNDRPLVTRFVLSRGADADGGLDSSPLRAAADKGNSDAVRVLLECGANVNAADSDGRTALEWACIRGRDAAVRTLLEFKPNINTVAKDSHTALTTTAGKGHSFIIQLLISHGADMEIKTSRSNSALLESLRMSHLETARVLVEKGASAKVVNHEGETPLHLAVEYKSEALAELLLRKGALIDARDWRGCTPLLRMPSSSSRAMVALLAQHGADMNSMDENKFTALTKACDWDAAELLQALLDHGASVTVGSEDTKPGVVAKQRDSTQCLAILKDIPGAIPED